LRTTPFLRLNAGHLKVEATQGYMLHTSFGGGVRADWVCARRLLLAAECGERESDRESNPRIH
jgi:hypothetical protein